MARNGRGRMVACSVFVCTEPLGCGHATVLGVPWFPRTVVEDSIRLYPLAVAQQIWGELMVPVSLSFSSGLLEYFALLVRTSGPVLLGLSRTVQGLFRKSVSDVLPVGTKDTMFVHLMGLATGSFCPAGCRNTEDPLGGSVVPA